MAANKWQQISRANQQGKARRDSRAPVVERLVHVRDLNKLRIDLAQEREAGRELRLGVGGLDGRRDEGEPLALRGDVVGKGAAEDVDVRAAVDLRVGWGGVGWVGEWLGWFRIEVGSEPSLRGHIRV